MVAVGPLTSVLVTCAACVSAGVLIGGFVAGLVDLVEAGSHPGSDTRVRSGGYLGGIAAVGLVMVDLVIR
jgi:hypothetical protein